jgi:hypothetical protein
MKRLKYSPVLAESCLAGSNREQFLKRRQSATQGEI